MYKSNTFFGVRFSQKTQYLCQCKDRNILKTLRKIVIDSNLKGMTSVDTRKPLKQYG